MNRRRFTVLVTCGIFVVCLLIDVYTSGMAHLPILFTGMRKLVTEASPHVMKQKPAGHSQVYSETETPHPFCPHRPVRNLPDQTYNNVPKAWHTVEDLTSPQFTRFFLANPKHNYSVCDEVEVRIVVRNGRNESKGFGGDYFKVNARTKNDGLEASTSTDGEVYDYGNGTYSAFITLKWDGVIEIAVTLSFSSEAVYLMESYRRTTPRRFNTTGTFISPADPSIEEEVPCSFMPYDTDMSTQCNLTDREVVWFCQKPRNVRLTCHDFKKSTRSQETFDRISQQDLNATEAVAFSRWDMSVGGTLSVHVAPQIEGNIEQAISILPPCNRQSYKKHPRVSGFFVNGRFISPYCKIPPFESVDAIKKCMANKYWIFHGDSTIRQLYGHIVKALQMDKSSPPLTKEVGFDDKIDDAYGIHLHYEFHGLPAFCTGKDVRFLPPVHAYIDTIPVNASIVSVVGIGQHVLHLPLDVYGQRIQATADEARRLLSTHPDSMLIFKSVNTHSQGWARRIVLENNWNARRLVETQRAVVARNKNVGFIDAWESTYAQFKRDWVHPYDPHTANLLRMLLAMVC